MNNKIFYITTPIYYVNAAPHIGTAYTTLVCDVIARFKTLEGYEVKFLTGTDEHGQKVEKAAHDAGLTPHEFVDKMSEKFRFLAQKINTTNNDFIRTTEPRHYASAKAFWNKLKENGHIYLGEYSGWYSVRDESFYAETELIDGKAPTGADVQWISESSYFFDLSKWQDKLLEFYKNNPNFVMPKWRLNEVVKFVESGLHDLSISRTTFKWGIPIPGDEDHVMYVWLDALTNYISALGYPDTNAEDFKKFWPVDVHMVGKDITKFHAIYWPAFLMAADLPVPKQIVSHGWWLNGGEKISKSLGNVIDPLELIDGYGLDQFRYYFMREMSFGNDGNFTYESFINRTNSDLANKLGNLVQRTLSMVYKNCNQAIPEIGQDEILELYKSTPLLVAAAELFGKIKAEFELYEFHKVLESIFHFIDDINAYIDTNAPWELRKTNQEMMEKVLYVVLEAVRYAAILLLPFIPDSANNILDQLKVPTEQRIFEFLNIKFALKGQSIEAPVAVFPRIEDDHS